MKTAEEWAAQIGAKITKQDGFPLMPSEYSFIVKQIQLDAMREGMRMAAEEIYADGNPLSAKTRILKKAEQLNDKDL